METMDESGGVLPKPLALLREAWGIYRNRFWTLVGISLLPVLATVVPVAVVVLFLFFLKNPLSWWVLFVPFGLLWLLAVLIVPVWGRLALLYAIKGHEAKVGWREALRLGWPKIVPFWWVSLLLGFLVGGGLIFFVVPGLVLALFFSLTYFVLVAEDERGLNALFKSREYLRGYGWAVLWRLFCLGVFYVLALFLAAAVSRALFPNAREGLGSVVSFFLGPLTTVYVFLLYQKLKFLQKNLVWPPTRRRKISHLLIGLAGWGLALAALVAALWGGGVARQFWGRFAASDAASWEDCLKVRGSRVQQSYPGVCVTAEGRRFVQPLTEEERGKIQPPREAY